MFDTMTMTKIVGGFCGTLLVFMLGGWAAETIYHVGMDGHGEEAAERAFLIEVPDAEESGGEAEEPVDFETVFASADADAGEKVFGKCRACHKLNGENATGPHLDGVVGRAIDAVDGYAYSGALEQVGAEWTPENLNTFLENPKGAAPGTIMSFNGLPSVEDRANLIAYLQTTGG